MRERGLEPLPILRSDWSAEGGYAAALLLDRETAKPPAGAADVRVTVPCDEAPPVTLAGFTATVESDAGGGGALSKLETTPLLTVEETLDALGRARAVGYRPPGA